MTARPQGAGEIGQAAGEQDEGEDLESGHGLPFMPWSALPAVVAAGYQVWTTEAQATPQQVRRGLAR
jgi:hypothetical protein